MIDCRNGSDVPPTETGRLIARALPWIHEASNPYADWFFGERRCAREVIAEWMARPSSELSIGRSILAFEHDELRGCLIGLGGEDLRRCRAEDLKAVCNILGSGQEAESVLRLLLEASHRLFPPVEDKHFYVSRVGVDPAMRGRGFGREIVEAAIDKARKEGFERVRLDVCADNHRAIHLYESMGFEVVARSASAQAAMAYAAMEHPLTAGEAGRWSSVAALACVAGATQDFIVELQPLLTRIF
jgi:ribosomal protein S18 acetylase RimI-like enzyme